MPEYVYEKLAFFNAKVTRRRTGHLLLPSLADVFGGKLPKTNASVPLLLDLGAVDPKLRGTKLPFLGLPASIQRLDLERRKDGRYTIELPEHLGVPSLEELFELIDRESEERFAGTLPKAFQPGVLLDFVKVTREADWGKPLGWCPGEGVYFCSGTRKTYQVDGPEWLYAGCVRAGAPDFVYGFYNRKTRGVRLISECT